MNEIKKYFYATFFMIPKICAVVLLQIIIVQKLVSIYAVVDNLFIVGINKWNDFLFLVPDCILYTT